MKNIPVAEAKARFSDCVERAERGEPVVITRHGKAVAAIISFHDLKHVRKIQTAGPEEGLAGLAGGWKNSDELAEILQKTRRSRQRIVPNLD